jgi:hypothetical protein
METKAKATLFTWNLMKYKTLFILLALGGFAFATCAAGTTPEGKIKATMCTICELMQNILPIIGLTLMVLAGVAYGSGQFFGADTRAKAAGWGMACLTGAIIMFVIYLVGPMIVIYLYQGTSGTWSCSGIGT